ncbi:MAG: hypothetical protein E7170_00505 [Firmicutes bacterium]|nr:hypothetical protein [Bacillota bacterium]
MDIVLIIIVLGAVLVMIFKKFSSFVYYIAMTDIFLRILAFIAANLPLTFLTNFLNTYFPKSIPNIIDIYSSGIFQTVFMWLLLIIYCIFDFYIARTFLKKK